MWSLLSELNRRIIPFICACNIELAEKTDEKVLLLTSEQRDIEIKRMCSDFYYRNHISVLSSLLRNMFEMYNPGSVILSRPSGSFNLLNTNAIDIIFVMCLVICCLGMCSSFIYSR